MTTRRLARAVFAVACVAIMGGAYVRLHQKPGGFICPPSNLIGSMGTNAKVSCSNGWHAAKIESESATAIYVCGGNMGDGGITASNFTTTCDKRCTTCNHGARWDAEIKGPGQI